MWKVDARRAAVALALFAVPWLGGCKLTPKAGGDGGGGAGSAAGGAGGSGGASCGDRPACEDCRACAADGPCADALAACVGDSACVAIDQCMSLACDGTEADCLAVCESQNPSGSTPYRAVRSCIDCDSCGASCASPAICGG